MIGRPRSDRVGGRLLLAGALALAALGALAALATLAPTPARAESEPAGRARAPLAVACSTWVFPSRPLVVTLEQSGVLAGRRLAIDLFVDDNQVQRVATKGGRTESRLELPPLAPGAHVLAARTARESARTEFRVVPWSWLAGALAAPLVVVVLALALRRRQRPPRAV